MEKKKYFSHFHYRSDNQAMSSKPTLEPPLLKQPEVFSSFFSSEKIFIIIIFFQSIMSEITDKKFPDIFVDGLFHVEKRMLLVINRQNFE
jgi:hypothetical protein